MIKLDGVFSRWPETTLWVLTVLIAIVSLRFLVADVAVVMQPMLHHVMDRPLGFFAHVGFAPIALVLLPLQFSKRVRARWLSLHRWAGRVYALSILISGVGGFYIAIYSKEGLMAQSGFMTLAVFWVGVTAVAVYYAMTRQITLHKAWMIRSAALTLSAVTLRLYLPIGAMTVGLEVAYPYIAWACWVPNLMVAEWMLRSGRGAARFA